MSNYDKLRRQGESVGKYHTRLMYVSFQNGFKGGNMVNMADFIVINNLVDALESFNPVGEPKDDLTPLQATPDAVCSECGALYRQHNNRLYPTLCFGCIARRAMR